MVPAYREMEMNKLELITKESEINTILTDLRKLILERY